MVNSELTTEVLNKSRMMFFEIKKRQINSVMRGEMFILHFISHKNGAVLPSELSVVTKTSTARVAMALKNLESKGYVERNVDKADRRKVLVTITDTGIEEVKQQHERILLIMEKLVNELGEADVKEYIRIVDRVIEISRSISLDE